MDIPSSHFMRIFPFFLLLAFLFLFWTTTLPADDDKTAPKPVESGAVVLATAAQPVVASEKPTSTATLASPGLLADAPDPKAIFRMEMTPPVTYHLDSVSTQAGLVTEFMSAPAWACQFKLGPLPDALKPMGVKTDAEKKQLSDLASAAALSAAAKPDKSLVAISPFLAWISGDPNAAAIAHQQAAMYQTQNINAPGATGPTPYWVPPPPPVVADPTTTTSSAAIYERPLH